MGGILSLLPFFLFPLKNETICFCFFLLTINLRFICLCAGVRPFPHPPQRGRPLSV